MTFLLMRNLKLFPEPQMRWMMSFPVASSGDLTTEATENAEGDQRAVVVEIENISFYPISVGHFKTSKSRA